MDKYRYLYLSISGFQRGLMAKYRELYMVHGDFSQRKDGQILEIPLNIEL
jgi:hypothetical protein